MNTGRTHFKKGCIPWNKGRKQESIANERHYSWKGENVSYSGLHYWISRKLGKPRICGFCKTESAKKYEWANISKDYKRDLSDWIRLCTSCHRKYDGHGYKMWESRRNHAS